ncbi:protein translocase subunit secF;protein translocase subunit secD [Desulfobulbus propionicus DSM 2032]|uniref:Multifunctional fusion protein n=1 Tax=Desulfobulbus propionicus (strain ATCC 33891 / DSM 2032 / VKM B-1956 / 1pr3) TaxID=577650 RepID=A0A7U3YPD8_DESPD|nr:protein translocase subunit SecDF [Desulfobulbus propionicus]ADW19084.1 protein translocase subunit secF;protein translocase subunit secD [Desulfobulbus propionicus DSM 2032]
MTTSIKLKIWLVIFLLFFSGLVLAPSVYHDLPDWWKKYLAPAGLKLGLDLQGGMHIVLQVDLDKAAENSLDLSASDFKSALAAKNINAVRMDTGTPNAILFTLPNTSAIETVKQILKENFPNLDSQVEAEAGTFPRITLRLKSEEVEFIRKNAVNQSLEIIRNRIDQFGVAEPIVLRQGENQIVVQLPGVKDPQRAMSLIGQTAQLEFKMVAEAPGLNLGQMIDEVTKTGQWREGDSRKQLNFALQNRLPQGTEIYFEKVIDSKTKKESRIPILLENPVLMTGEMVKNAQVRIGGTFNEPYVSLDLTGHGGQVFAHLTEKNVNRRLAIVLDEIVRSAPVIREKILGGSAQISGNFTHNEATDLAIVLRVGALPAPVDIIQNLTVGASLGQDSIKDGLSSGLFGALLVIAFMVLYYRVSGIIANVSLALNILFLFVGLAMLGATLTLPGIAGIILSIGMGVDANILIYERMRDEFALGKSLRSGVDAGFNKAFWSIVDGQVTTLITALVLFLFGTGPIKGFAITLTLGILFNLFAVLFFSRLMYDSLLSLKWLKRISFLKLIGKTNFDFMRLRKVAYSVSAVLVALGLIAFVQIMRGHANMGVDFSGGTMLQYKAEQAFSLEEVRGLLRANEISGVDLQQVTNENRLIVKIKKSEEKVSNLGDRISTILGTDQAHAGFTLESKSEIGASVSADLRNKAVISIILSMLGVVVYLAFRFDFRFGLAATVATLHDVLAVLGVCWLMDKEMNLLIVTALLTLAGYSLNDTVVIFDRIRENMYTDERLTFFQIINESINQVLGRSIMTGMSVLFCLASLFFFGGATLHDFSFALLVGLVVAFFSSVFVASPLLTITGKSTSES